MKNQNPLTPTLKTNFIKPEIGELDIQYRPGYPRCYRFDASRGLFNLNGETNITKKGEALTFIPIAHRVFRDNILGFGLKKWCEFFFLNEDHQLCSLLFHSYSVENLERYTTDLFYDNVNLSQVILTAKPIEKVKQHGEGKDKRVIFGNSRNEGLGGLQRSAPQSGQDGFKYFIAEFTYKVLETDQQTAIHELGQSLPIWRAETLTGDAVTEVAINYTPPITQINGTGIVADEALHKAEATKDLAGLSSRRPEAINATKQ